MPSLFYLTRAYRLCTQWDDAELWGIELYDHAGDPSNSWGDYENVNLAQDPAHTSVVQMLHAQLIAKWAKPEDFQ